MAQRRKSSGWGLVIGSFCLLLIVGAVALYRTWPSSGERPIPYGTWETLSPDYPTNLFRVTFGEGKTVFVERLHPKKPGGDFVSFLERIIPEEGVRGTWSIRPVGDSWKLDFLMDGDKDKMEATMSVYSKDELQFRFLDGRSEKRFTLGRVK